MALVPMELDNSQWEAKTMTVTSGVGDATLYVNYSLKMAIVAFSSGANNNSGYFTLPSDIVPLLNVSAAVRDSNISSRAGYLAVYANNLQGTIENVASYTVGELVFIFK